MKCANEACNNKVPYHENRLFVQFSLMRGLIGLEPEEEYSQDFCQVDCLIEQLQREGEK